MTVEELIDELSLHEGNMEVKLADENVDSCPVEIIDVRIKSYESDDINEVVIYSDMVGT